MNVVFRPAQPVFDRRLNIEDSPAVQLCGIHLTDLILCAVLTAIYGSDDKGVGMETPAVDLAAIGQFEEALTDFDGSAVDLIEEKHDRTGTSLDQPVRSIPSCSTATIWKIGGVGQTEEVTLSHLRSTTLNHRKFASSGNLIDNFGLTDAVTTTNQDWKPRIEDVRSDGQEGVEVNSHDLLPFLWVVV
jgi:hypothetical protein